MGILGARFRDGLKNPNARIEDTACAGYFMTLVSCDDSGAHFRTEAKWGEQNRKGHRG